MRVDASAGAYVLRTSHAGWDPERVLRTYWDLTEVEATFRSLKSELGLRPIWHSLDRRVSAHQFLTVLSCHAVHLIRSRLKAHGPTPSWPSIRDRLANWVRITTTLCEAAGSQTAIRQDVRPNADAFEISRAAGVTPRIHRRQFRTTHRQIAQRVVLGPLGSLAQPIFCQPLTKFQSLHLTNLGSGWA